MAFKEYSLGGGGAMPCTLSSKVPVFCSRLAWSFLKTCDWLVSSFLNADWTRKVQASLEQKTGTFGDDVHVGACKSNIGH